MSVTPPASMALAVRDFRYSSMSGGIASPRALRSSASKRAIQARISSKNAMSVRKAARAPLLEQSAYMRASWADAWRNRWARSSSPSSTWLPGVAGSRR